MQKEFEDTTGEIKIRTSQDRHDPRLNPRVNLCAPKREVVPGPLCRDTCAKMRYYYILQNYKKQKNNTSVQ